LRIELRTSDFAVNFPFLILHSSFFILYSSFSTPTFFCSSNDGGENGDELIGLVEQLGQTRLGNEFGGCYKTKPVVCFTGFCTSNEELVDKVWTALSRLGFFNVRAYRRARAQ